MKECSSCRESKPIEDFPRDVNQWGGIKPYCRICSSRRSAEYYAKNKEKRLKTVRKYYLSIKDTPIWREKNNARVAVREKIRIGKLKKEPCKECGEIKVQAHHYAGYKMKNRFKIHWLCKIHHERIHHPHPLITNPASS